MGEVRVEWTDEDSAVLAANRQTRDMLVAAREMSGRIHVRELLRELIANVDSRAVDLKMRRTASGWRSNTQCGSTSHRSEWA
jgi:hypothetical protein